MSEITKLQEISTPFIERINHPFAEINILYVNHFNGQQDEAADLIEYSDIIIPENATNYLDETPKNVGIFNVNKHEITRLVYDTNKPVIFTDVMQDPLNLLLEIGATATIGGALYGITLQQLATEGINAITSEEYKFTRRKMLKFGLLGLTNMFITSSWIGNVVRGIPSVTDGFLEEESRQANNAIDQIGSHKLIIKQPSIRFIREIIMAAKIHDISESYNMTLGKKPKIGVFLGTMHTPVGSFLKEKTSKIIEIIGQNSQFLKDKTPDDRYLHDSLSVIYNSSGVHDVSYLTHLRLQQPVVNP